MDLLLSIKQILLYLYVSMLNHYFLLCMFCLHRFHWSCNPLGKKDVACFDKPGVPQINMKTSILTFQIDWLSADTYEFEVTVSKDTRNFSTFQILYVILDRPHL